MIMIRLAFIFVGMLLVIAACLTPLLGQYLAYHGPAWMGDETTGLGIGTVLSLMLLAMASGILGAYLVKEAME